MTVAGQSRAGFAYPPLHRLATCGGRLPLPPDPSVVAGVAEIAMVHEPLRRSAL